MRRQYGLDKVRDGQLTPNMASLRLRTKRKGVNHLLNYIIRQIEADAKISEQVRMEALEQAVPYVEVQAVIAAYGLQRQRKRKLSAEMGLLLGIAMHLFRGCSLGQVLWKLMKGVRLLWPEVRPASKGAISQLRYAIGARPMVDLFHRVCKPMARVDTPGAFWNGLRLMGIDGTEESTADTLANERFFGRHSAGWGVAAFPQLKAVHLVEIGTHAVVDTGVWPVHSGEKTLGKRLLRSLEAGMLVLWDCGFHSFDMVQKALATGAHILTRLPANVKVEVIRRLTDGSTLIDLVQRDHKGRRVGEALRLRLIEYTVRDPALPGYGERRRLITSLLDEADCPALELARLYHERWEVEITIDEIDTHQRQAADRFRSLKPVGVIQEFYGLLIAHYVVRKILLDAAHTVNLDPDRLSFTNALELIVDAIYDFQFLDPAQHPARYHQLLRDITAFQLPPRVTRSNPRVIRAKLANFKMKRPQHYHWPQPACSFAEAIVLI
jgi:hypothetical protein